MKLTDYKVRVLIRDSRRRISEGEEPFEDILKDVLAKLEAMTMHSESLKSMAQPYILGAALAFDVAPNRINSKERTRMVFTARTAAMMLLKEQGLSTQDIGRVFKRDESTVSDAMKSLRGRLSKSNLLAQRFDVAREKAESLARTA